ncbi:3'-5' exonuclease [Rathayibacter sp. AY1A7]|uniref:3'-5' exonuclease n=1 Tax=Rathayibacter sp. AY1A7 TaxID=2080524 RepID=UPI000CE82013|nr:3'-5' exonuclease [Rathayibacter sp. AY1A7]PPF20859.1 hypothetical protein C5B95_07295 [Rathayibacter sp. AY1A7]
MRILPAVTPTAEQLTILLESRPGVFVVNGAAGSGKTTTALLRLTRLCGQWLSRKQRLGLTPPVRVLVLTYNKTLEGYISELAKTQVADSDVLAAAVAVSDLQLEVSTFGKWAMEQLPSGSSPDADDCGTLLSAFAAGFPLPLRFVTDEVEYLLGRFPAGKLESYIGCARDGRGSSPRMDAAMRRRLLDEVVYPYLAEKEIRHLRDWNDITAEAKTSGHQMWDIVIVDEAQDFAANQIRTLMAHVADPHSVTFVMDAAQRIYPRSFTWKEVGITVTASKKLDRNYRNTAQIAAFARSLLEGMVIGDDGTMPNFEQASTAGSRPRLLVGKFSEQLAWTLEHVVKTANLKEESVAFLHPLGGGWFDYLKTGLRAASVPFVQLTRASTWPGGDETVALSTIHSAKGLEFDHVIVLGLNQQVTPHGEGDGDAQLEYLRRLLAMGIGRARKTVTLGFKDGEASDLIDLLDPTTYERVAL